MNTHLDYLVLEWLNCGYSLSDFPYVLLNYSNLEEFYRYISTLYSHKWGTARNSKGHFPCTSFPILLGLWTGGFQVLLWPCNHYTTPTLSYPSFPLPGKSLGKLQKLCASKLLSWVVCDGCCQAQPRCTSCVKMAAELRWIVGIASPTPHLEASCPVVAAEFGPHEFSLQGRREGYEGGVDWKGKLAHERAIPPDFSNRNQGPHSGPRGHSFLKV